MATVKTLSGKEDHAEDASAEKGSENYTKLVAHHKDNYSMLIGESILDGLVGSVKVIDDMKKDEQGEIDSNESVEKNAD